MTISPASLARIPASFATVSVGTTSTPLSSKLSAISSAGFTAIELGFPDLLSFANTFHEKEIKENDYDSLCAAGSEVKKLCEKNKLGVGSSDSPDISSDFKVLAADLRELADLLAEHNYRLAYENWCWATHASTWREVWQIVQLVDRPNIGLCLDTFQTAGGEYGDPSTSSGLISHLGTQAKLHMNLTQSLQSLTATVPPEKIYLLQISDAYKPPTPIPTTPPSQEKHDLRARGKWSHDFRPYPFNGGYLPIVEVARAVLGTGFRGWFSTEVFDGGANGKWTGIENLDLEAFCKGAMEGHKKLLEECGNPPSLAKKLESRPRQRPQERPYEVNRAPNPKRTLDPSVYLQLAPSCLVLSCLVSPQFDTGSRAASQQAIHSRHRMGNRFSASFSGLGTCTCIYIVYAGMDIGTYAFTCTHARRVVSPSFSRSVKPRRQRYHTYEPRFKSIGLFTFRSSSNAKLYFFCSIKK
ncbi:hypothetical protein EYC84_007190 [Monilinia fructicola]|uniref:Xylose isomerase-like TIM barrel domain-containing protein n=1 Tax=Monilinia fructicola TaxID=38448 RepID=A0A5M9KAC1_MONFR|nr:hypothetical protein EYC84_007190 [Monilinia fructicola]